MDRKSAIFDMDGTLVDSIGYWVGLPLEYLKTKGISEVSPEIIKQFEPMTMSQSAAFFRRTFGLTGDLEAEMNAHMAHHYEAHIGLKSGAEALLRQLHQQGVRLCIASTTAPHLIRACLTRLQVIDYFDFLLSCEEVGASKRQPDIYLEAARRFGRQPQDIAVYEDSVFAAKTAKNAGFYVIGVREAYENESAMRAIADAYITLD